MLVTIVAPSSSPPLLDGLGHLTNHGEPVALAWDDVAGMRTLAPADVDLPPGLAFALEPADLVALAKPFLLLHLARTVGNEPLLFVDAGCLVERAPQLSPPAAGTALELFAELPPSLAAAKPSAAAAVTAGLGRPGSDVQRLVSGSAAIGLLEDWRAWMSAAHVAQPTGALDEAERRFLAALPGARPEVGWNHDQVVGLWSDLHPELPRPPLVSTRGTSDYLTVAGAAGAVAERRTHSHTAVAELFSRYRPSGPAPVVFFSGERATPLARAVLRAVDPWCRRWPDPWNDGDGGYRAWLERRDDRGLPRYGAALYWSRPDLRESFPPPSSAVDDYVHWLDRNGIGAVERQAPPPAPLPVRAAKVVVRRLSDRLGRRRARLADARTRPTGPVAGVNVIGYATAESGLGEAMRATTAAVAAAGFDTAVLDLSERVYSRQRAAAPPPDVAAGTPYDVSILHLNPEEMMGYATDSLAYRLAAGWHIGFWFWETDTIPAAWRDGLDLVDELWVASEFLRTAFAAVTPKPISVMGLPVEVPAGVAPDRSRFGFGESEFVVLFVADAYSSDTRKNPLLAIEAFAEAFGPDGDGARLVLKISNLEKLPALADRLAEAATGAGVTVIGDYLDRADLWRLMATADAYLSLHASEGFGFTVLEAMALGKPVIVTDYGGTRDFVDAGNALVVGYDLVPASGGLAGIYSRGGRWARPDTSQAAAHLRRLRNDADLAARLGEAGRRAAARFSSAAYAGRVTDRLRALGLVESSNLG